MKEQVIGWWSAGVTSAVAVKMAMDMGHQVIPIYFETCSAHEDNARFMRDCEERYGTQIITFKNSKYSSVIDLVNKRRFLNGPGGALCTSELKKEVRFAIEKWMPYSSQVFGFEYEPKE